MKIASKYILREHLGPLAFSLTALTSLLLLQYVARQLDKLVGKGLPWRVIGEFLLLSLPFTVAMTLPMAVLVATLHAFGRLAVEHEVTAFKASGVRVRTLMTPVLGAAAVLSLLMLGFNDQVLPRANHRLSILLAEIMNVRPTVGLREQVLTELTPTFYMRVGWIDDRSNRMRDVQIYDLQNSMERKSIAADSGTFMLSPDSVDLHMVLYNGEQLHFPEGETRQLQRTFFREQVLKVRNLTRSFAATSPDDSYKGEREQGICELQQEYEQRAAEYERRRQTWIAQLTSELKPGERLRGVPKARPAHGGLARWYCSTLPNIALPKKAEAQPPAQGATQPPAKAPLAIPTVQDTVAERLQREQEIMRQEFEAAVKRVDSLRKDSIRQEAQVRDSIIQQQIQADPNTPPPAIFTVTPELLDDALMQMNKYAVEVQKKFALSLAVLVFVLFGPPIAVRFPRGGVGVTIGISLVVFGAYYICLMAGETLADKGRLDPVVAMWAANVLFTIAGVLLLLRVERAADMSRGGGLRDWWSDRRARRASS